MTRSGALFSLQRLDEQLAGLRSEISAIENALAADPELDRLRGQAEAARAARASAEQAASAAESHLAQARQRARQLERRLYGGSVGNPQELLGLQREVEALQPRIEELEASLLERMQASDDAEASLVAADSAVAARDADRRAQDGPRRQRLDLAALELSELVADRAASAAEIDPADLKNYERIAARRTPAVVRLDRDSCGGCHLPLGIHEVRQARMGDLVIQCSNCDRIVVS